jgi:hypothetical protein
MHKVTEAKLEARCAAINKANKAAAEALPEAKKWIESIMGQRIYKADGTLMAKFLKTRPILEGVRWVCGEYSIYLDPETSMSIKYIDYRGKEDWVSERGGFSHYLAKVSDGVVTEWDGAVDNGCGRTDYDHKEAIRIIEKLEAKSEEMDALVYGWHGIVSIHTEIRMPT